MANRSFHTAPSSIRPITEGCPVEVFRWGGPQDHHPDEMPHAHPFDEILLINRGGGTHFIDGQWYSVENNSVHFIRVGAKHKLNRTSDTEGGTVLFMRDYLHLEPALPFKQLFFLEANPVLSLPSEAFAEVWLIYEQLLREAQKKGQFYPKQHVLSWLNILLVKVAELYRSRFPNTIAAQDLTIPARLTQAFQDALATRFRQQKSVEFYAGHLCITPKYLYEICIKHLDKSPQAVIADVITTEALLLLQNSHEPVKNIAASLGFQDQGYFSRFIKKRTGKAPVDWQP